MKTNTHLADSLNVLRTLCYTNSKEAGWYTDLKTGLPKVINDGERLMLIVSEVSEAMEGLRKNLMDDKLPHRPMAEAELADALIRIFDFAGYKGYDLGGAVMEKIAFNKTRPDHQVKARLEENGKAF